MSARDVIVWGGTGQAKVIRPILEASGHRVIAVFDDTRGLVTPFHDVPLVGGRDAFPAWLRERRPADLGFCLAIGNPHGRVRLQLAQTLKEAGLTPVSAVHATAVIAPDVAVGEGAQVHALAIANPGVSIGSQCILNTRASIDHECVIADGVEIGPGAVLCGDVRVDVGAWVCAGATVLPRLHIGADAIVGAGSVVREDVPPRAVVAGVPARMLRSREEKIV